MSKSIPPNVQLPLPTKQGQFTLSPEKTVGQLASEIQNLDKKARNVSVNTLDGSTVDLDTTLDKISNRSFWIHVNKNKIRVFPSVVQMMTGQLSYKKICEDIGVSHSDAVSICRYVSDMEQKLPEEFDADQLEAISNKVLGMQNQYHEEDIRLLKLELELLKGELEPLDSRIEAAKLSSDIWAGRILKMALATILGQISFFCTTIWGLYGWDTMEPITYLVGSAWLVVGYTYFMINKQEYAEKGLRELIDAKQFRRIVKKQGIDLRRVELLKKNISEIQDQINRLS